VYLKNNGIEVGSKAANTITTHLLKRFAKVGALPLQCLLNTQFFPKEQGKI
jgi:hypothetical protein